MRKVEVVLYQDTWPEAFEHEAMKIREIFQGHLAALHHIGSTSVRGLAAKPVIDMLPVVYDIHSVDNFTQRMHDLGYQARGEFGLVGRRFFEKGGDSRTHHAHFYQIGSPEIVRHLAFRDFLRVHDEVRDAYSRLKLALSKRFPSDMEAYIQNKAPFIKDMEQQAMTWYRQHKHTE